MTTTVEIYEDNSGGVYLAKDRVCWYIDDGLAGDKLGQAVEDAKGWVEGDWRPEEVTGQYIADADELDHIATWTPDGGLTVHRDDNGMIAAGGGGRAYLGLSDDED